MLNPNALTLKQYKIDKTKQINALENNAIYLFDYSNKLATLIANYEKVCAPSTVAQPVFLIKSTSGCLKPVFEYSWGVVAKAPTIRAAT